MNKFLYSMLAGLLISTSVYGADTFMIKLADQLDESEFYCIDVTGWGDHLKLDDPLQVHTCKPNSPDQEFVVAGSSLKMPEYDRCLTVSASGSMALPGSAVLLRECDGSAMQNLKLLSSGQIVLNDSDLCVAAGTTSMEASGPSHLWRVASVQSCETTDKELTTWQAQ
ncbi:RICIN domain-containing protein [Reinekea thalattae]|uniref:Ricin-type beta-trefoil lectin domain protein n=1 Tax=Reinekea thalattae TaxID=2593301 RepID=A0A5C8Z8K2_9GAMM|nr:ricin-type beta-trefoil lectin domain protein [Reinekea thalattae]TXR53674.1 ricin-type beta-trefoil lectin domain protein [Reinekea thalattae]